MRRLVQLAAVVGFGLTFAGCASSTTASAYVQRNLDFKQYHTYDWGPADALPTGDPRLDQNAFFRDHLEGAVEKQLVTKGLERSAEAGMPDLRIHYHATTSKRLDVNQTDTEYGYCYDDDCRARVTEYEAATLVVDLVDAHTNRIVWRGWAQHSLEGVLDNPDRMAQRINEAVTGMMQKFPRAL